jgi:MFS transporter, putative metabolite transport protein
MSTTDAIRSRSIEDAPWSRFLVWTLLYVTMGMLLDGYIFGITGYGMAMAKTALGFDDWTYGLVTASVLVGVLLGSLVVGPICDRVGRQVLFTVDLCLFIAASVLSLWIHDVTLLFVLRFTMGVAIGAEYAIGTTLLSEFLPSKSRGLGLAFHGGFWVVGFGIGFMLGYGVQGGGHWQWLFASPAIPAIALLLMRLGAPESPRWLMTKGKVERARGIVKKHWGADYDVDDLAVERSKATKWRTLFSGQYRRRTLFSASFWTLQVTVMFALFMFFPLVFEAVGIKSEGVGNLVTIASMVLGCFVGIYLIAVLSRRAFTLWTFVLMGGSLIVMAAYNELSSTVIVIGFACFALVSSAAQNIEFVYPAELFPTEVRSSGVGFSAAASRIGASVSTFVMPVVVGAVGASWALLALAAVSMLGAVVTYLWAPETKGRTLLEASGVETTAAGSRHEHARHRAPWTGEAAGGVTGAVPAHAYRDEEHLRTEL